MSVVSAEELDVDSESQSQHLLTLLEDVYEDSLLNEAYAQLTDGNVDAGMTDLCDRLCERRLQSSEQEWGEFFELCVRHPIRELIHECPITERSFSKPRGYAGDALLMDWIYGTRRPEKEVTELGQAIAQNRSAAPAAEGCRARVQVITQVVDELARKVSKPKMLSVAAGHLREAGFADAGKKGAIGQWVAFDQDVQSLQEINDSYASLGVETVAGTVAQLVRGSVDLGKYDLIYSTGLFDYLRQSLGQRLVKQMFDMLLPGGQLMIANFKPRIRDLGYMESFMDWKLIYRKAPEMVDLASMIDDWHVQEMKIRSEDNQNIMFFEITKKR